jgi:hypothetical protein
MPGTRLDEFRCGQLAVGDCHLGAPAVHVDAHLYRTLPVSNESELLTRSVLIPGLRMEATRPT